MQLSFEINREQHLLRQYKNLELINQGPQLPSFKGKNNESAIDCAESKSFSVFGLRHYLGKLLRY